MKITTSLAVSSIAGFMAYTSTGMFFPIIAVYALSLGADRFTAGFIAGAQTLVTALTMLIFGMISDIIGRRKLIIMGLLIYAIAPLLYITARNPIELLAIRLIHGLAPSTFIPSATAYVVDRSSDLGKGYIIGTFTTSTQMGYAIGPLIGGAIYQLIGFNIFLIASAIPPLLGLTLFILYDKTEQIESKSIYREAVSWIDKDSKDSINHGYRIYILATATLILSTLIAAAVGLYIIPLLTHSISGASAIAGSILFALFLSSSLVRMPVGYISDRAGKTQLIVVGLILQIIGVAILTNTEVLIAIALGSILVGGGMGISNTMSIALISEAAPSARRGIGMGLGGTSIQLGVAIGPSLAGYLYTFLAIEEILYIFIVFIVVFTAIVGLSIRHKR